MGAVNSATEVLCDEISRKKSMLQSLVEIKNELSEYSLCDHCLGRLFGKFGHGFGNAERGRAVRYCLKKAVRELKEEDVARFSALKSPTRVDCWLCGNIFDETEKFALLAIEKMRKYEFSSFLVGSKIDSEIIEREEELRDRLNLEYHEQMKSEINREIGKIVEEKTGKKVNFSSPDITAIVDTRYDNVTLQLSSLFIYGRYKKFLRGIPQTKWPCKKCWGKGCEKCSFTGKMYSTSVEEIIAKVVMEKTNGSGHFFHGMGREDVDARMLGNGRPFILEIRNPAKRYLDLKKMEKEINDFGKGRVEVSGIRLSDASEVVKIKDAKPEKTYRVVVLLEKSVSEEKLKELENAFPITVTQRTPLRVVHRRADKIRERKVLDFKVESADEIATFIIKGESGLYVKELVSGDNGRTLPSIAEMLGIECRVKELDVIGVEYGEGIERA
ncbi:MAG: tRNA pseudouridine(54/55) synthase Pus10 [Thermoplasmatales archaeon]|nr:tRNA pseudouridine(54/55) synthase Pus10 [Thermoplasmatales archaeon]